MLRDYQKKSEAEIFKTWKDFRRVMYQLPTGGGKCLGKGTPVLMYDGSIKNVENVKTGDLLIGPDSKQRKVLSICKGTEMLYRITPKKGDSWICNESHILSLKRTKISNVKKYPSCKGGEIVNIPLRQYLKTSKTFKHEHKQYRAAVTFKSPFGDLLLDPYFLGLWLGDGRSSGPSITTGDQEIKNYLKWFAGVHGLRVRVQENSKWSENYNLVGVKRKRNILTDHLDTLGVLNNKHIPDVFKFSNRDTRLHLLAGLLDSDGHYTGKGFDLCLKSERLIDDAIFVARSLGFSAYKSRQKKKCCNNGVTNFYFRCTISGDVNLIPCLIDRKKAKPRRQIKNVLVTGFKIEPIGIGDYYGFEIDGDRLFLLGDFTVTHNTVVLTNIIRAALMRSKRVIFIAHREELITQAWNTFYKNEIYSGIIKADVKPNFSLPCQVGSIQTMIRRKQLPAADLVIIDEAHHAMDDNSYGKVIEKHYPGALVLGVTATPYRLNGRGFTKLFDDLIESVQIKDLIDMGYLVSLKYFAASTPDLSSVSMSKGDYMEKEAAEAMRLAPIVESYFEHAKGLTGLVFACNVEHSKSIVKQYNEAGVEAAHVDANTPPVIRKEIFTKLREKKIKILVNVGIATEGVDIPNLDFVQLARPTKSLSLFYQMVGRVTRVDNETIKEATSDEHRKFLISCSAKPFGIILDNGGLWKDHGLPEDPQNWRRYFIGIDKKKKKQGDYIEIIEFVAEDETGRRVRTEIPEEVEGMKLIEISKKIKDKIVNLKSLTEFDRLLAMAYHLKNVNKVGYFALYKYKEFCVKNGYLMSNDVWDYLRDKLVTTPKLDQEREINKRESTLRAVAVSYANNPEELERIQKSVIEKSEKIIQRIKLGSVNGFALKKEKEKYLQELKPVNV